jgi:hypothetical protein
VPRRTAQNCQERPIDRALSALGCCRQLRITSGLPVIRQELKLLAPAMFREQFGTLLNQMARTNLKNVAAIWAILESALADADKRRRRRSSLAPGGSRLTWGILYLSIVVCK